MADTRSTTQPSKNAAREPCCGAAPTKPPSSCCELTCFERPRYFCGHLLTDDDLSREQRYVVNKNKLYHRSLHGHGVVCGLRLTCDPACAGRVLVGDGYAIDDCGNDLVVCASTPFDVLGLLREKGWVTGKPKADPYKKKDEERSDCPYRQCFYVVACYEEELADYTTPFSATCTPPTGQCEATRIRERVRFDVLDDLPEPVDACQRIRARIEGCSRLFTHGPFAQALQKHAEGVEQAIEGQGSPEYVRNLFCELRGLFLLYLERHPDPYRCGFADEVRRLSFPHDLDWQGEGEDESSPAVAKAFCRLLDLC